MSYPNCDCSDPIATKTTPPTCGRCHMFIVSKVVDAEFEEDPPPAARGERVVREVKNVVVEGLHIVEDLAGDLGETAAASRIRQARGEVEGGEKKVSAVVRAGRRVQDLLERSGVLGAESRGLPIREQWKGK